MSQPVPPIETDNSLVLAYMPFEQDNDHSWSLVLRQALAMVGMGILLGIVLSLVAGWWLSSELYGVSPGDPLTLIGAPLFLCGVAIVATLLPARRAARVDPLIALRAE